MRNESLVLTRSSVLAFFAYARERWAIRQRRDVAGLPPPWTDDPILREFRFCNIFREHDRTTAWIRENVREPLRGSPDVLFAVVAARWFNRITTLERVSGLLRKPFPFRRRSFESRLRGASPLVTGAYMIRTPTGRNKLDGILDYIQYASAPCRTMGRSWARSCPTLRHATRELSGIPGMGPFLAYEVVTDLTHTDLLQSAVDQDWCSLGPGAVRGLARMTGSPVFAFSHHRHADQERLLPLCRELMDLANSGDDDLWPRDLPRWGIREVEHTLCEFDKYERTRLGEGRPKQKFKERKD